MFRAAIFVFVTIFCVFCSGTEVLVCKNGKALGGDVKISNCDKPPCILKKNTRPEIEMKFTPSHDITELRTKVSAQIGPVDVPFIGVDNTNACNNIYTANGEKASCPLSKGVEYNYKNGFQVLPLYPKISTRVHYELRDKSGQVACFEVPVKITN